MFFIQKRKFKELYKKIKERAPLVYSMIGHLQETVSTNQLSIDPQETNCLCPTFLGEINMENVKTLIIFLFFYYGSFVRHFHINPPTLKYLSETKTSRKMVFYQCKVLDFAKYQMNEWGEGQIEKF